MKIKEKGNYLEHFLRKTYRHHNIKFIQQYLQNAQELFSDGDILKYIKESTCIDGFIIHIGVYQARAINFVATLNPNKKIYGFDSFKGLSENWRVHPQTWIPGTKYANNNFPLLIQKNVVIYNDWTNSIIEKFKNEKLKDAPISFLYLNCYTYQMTKDMLNNFYKNFRDGTIIGFSAFYNYAWHADIFRTHQNKAFLEFIAEKNLKYEFIAYNYYDMQLAVKIIKE